jgi:hypothetical protein
LQHLSACYVFMLSTSRNSRFSWKWWLLWGGAYIAVPFIIFRAYKSQARSGWEQANKQAKRDFVVRMHVEKQQQETLQVERERDQQLAEENARYAPLGDRIMSSSEITETARRIAEEMKKG